MKNLMTLLTAFTMLCSFGNQVVADEPVEAAENAECCYEESRMAAYAAPAIAIGTVAIVAIIAVAVQNANSGHSHSTSFASHSHSH